MCDTKPIFAEAQVGDRVWDYRRGWSEIFAIVPHDVYSVVTKAGHAYTSHGNLWDADVTPSLFWDEIKFEIPPRPKRMVKKVLHGWVNVYQNVISKIYETEERADSQSLSNRIACVEINQKYEVEA